jgi:predicted SAM-dependent methyltransferase
MNIIGSDKDICINLGCGGETRIKSTESTNWINIDARNDIGADLVCDITKGLPYEDGTISKIVTIHMLEHMPRHTAPKVIAECFRVLKRGGTIDVEVPSFDLTIKSYLEGDDNLKKIRIENVYGRQFYDGDTHFWGYNNIRLKELLSNAGFTNIQEIKEWSYHQKFEPCLRMSGKKL